MIRYYAVEIEDQPPRIIEAPSASAAVRYVTKDTHKARVLNAAELGTLIKAGVAIEAAS